MTARSRYDGIAICLHWLIAGSVVALFVLGYQMTDAKPGSPQQFALYQWHKSIGITVLVLSLGRLIWRLTHRPPALPPTMPAWERRAAHATHILFYGFLIGLPLLGWATVSSSPFNIPTVLFGVVPWPHLPFLPTIDNKKVVSEALGDIHGTAAWIMAGLVVLHAGAALRHHFLLKDDILGRMVPFLAPPRRQS